MFGVWRERERASENKEIQRIIAASGKPAAASAHPSFDVCSSSSSSSMEAVSMALNYTDTDTLCQTMSQQRARGTHNAIIDSRLQSCLSQQMSSSAAQQWKPKSDNENNRAERWRLFSSAQLSSAQQRIRGRVSNLMFAITELQNFV